MMHAASISYAQRSECGALSELIAEVIKAIPYYNDLAKQGEVQKFTSFSLQQKIEEDPYSVIVARVNNQLAGFCLSRFDDYTIWLEWFGVLPEFRGKGIANLLLDGLKETAKPRRCHKIWCDCRTENKASIHILTAHGLRQLATINNHWYGQDFILWEKFV